MSIDARQPAGKAGPSIADALGPATLSEVISDLEREMSREDAAHLRPLATGFMPLDDILNGGLRPGELLVIGGPFGVGKTIWGLQVARNVVLRNGCSRAVYVCYEHDRAHLASRLLCLESAERGQGDEALTLTKVSKLAFDSTDGGGLISKLRRMPRYAPLVETIESYAERLVLIRASGDHSTLNEIRRWMEEVAASQPAQLLLVVDYLQKIPVDWSTLQPETEVTTYLVQGLKEMAMSMGLRVIAIAASDRLGLKSRRMRLADLRGSSAVQYEADIGLILNNKFAILSREHMVYNPAQAQSMRNWVVISVEKNRAGRNAVDMEHMLDAPHFRIVPEGGFVRERLVDEKITLE